jgi:hypothetical protein
MNADVLHFLHIPRTSGSSFAKDVQDMFSYGCMDSTVSCGQREFVNLSEHERINIFSGHNFTYGHFSATLIKTASFVKSISIIRDPYEHQISCLSYLMKDTNDTDMKKTARDWLVHDSKFSHLDTPFCGEQNPQVGYLTGKLMQNSIGKLYLVESADGGLDSILSQIKELNIVLSTFESRFRLFELVMKYFGYKIHDNFQQNHIGHKRHEQIEEILPAWTREYLETRHQLDFNLYRYITDYENSTNSLFNQEILSKKEVS